MFMCALMFLFMASEGVSQSKTVETINFRSYDDENQLIDNVTYEGDEASQLDILALIKENQDQERITVRGLFYNDLEVTRVKFDSRDAEDFHYAENFCKTTDFNLKPYLGVAAYSTDDLSGVTVERVVSTSPAGQAGILQTDVILNFNYIPVSSFCELKMEVEGSEVGQEIPVDIIRNGRPYTINVVLGGQVNNTVSYKACDEASPEVLIENENTELVFSELNVFPNPTADFVNLKFLSSSVEPMKFYVMNFNGAIIHQENVNVEGGVVKLSYAFANEADGTYLFVIKQGDELFEKKVIYTK